MPLNAEQLNELKIHFAKRTAQFAEAGYERFGAPEFILDQAGALAGPVLDVGTGTGITARALAGRGLEVVGVDMCADDLQMAGALTEDADIAGRIRYLVSDAARLPVPDGHFGSAVAVDFLHHLDVGEPGTEGTRAGGKAGWSDSPRGLYRRWIRDGLDSPCRGRAGAPRRTSDRRLGTRVPVRLRRGGSEPGDRSLPSRVGSADAGRGERRRYFAGQVLSPSSL